LSAFSLAFLAAKEAFWACEYFSWDLMGFGC